MLKEKRETFINYSMQYGFREIDNKILFCLKEQSQATISEISDYIGLFRANTIRRMQNQLELGMLENVGSLQCTRWTLKKVKQILELEAKQKHST